MSRVRVSAVISVYNQERYVAQAIESCLSQTRLPDEIIVVDDASTDGSADVVASYPQVRFVQNNINRGVVASRRRGVAASTGHLIAFLDADDLWLPPKLATQIAFFETHDSAEIVLTHVRQFLTPEKEAELARRYLVNDKPIPGYLPSAAMFRRASVNEFLSERQNAAVIESVEFFATAIESGVSIHVVPQVLTLRRIHGANATIQNNADWRANLPRILKAKIDLGRRKQVEQGQTWETQ